MRATRTITSAQIVDEAGSLARRFHEVHEHLWRKDKHTPEVPWDDMPESYRRRLLSTFEWMHRDGSINAGPGLGFHQADSEL